MAGLAVVATRPLGPVRASDSRWHEAQESQRAKVTVAGFGVGACE